MSIFLNLRFRAVLLKNRQAETEDLNDKDKYRV